MTVDRGARVKDAQPERIRSKPTPAIHRAKRAINTPFRSLGISCGLGGFPKPPYVANHDRRGCDAVKTPAVRRKRG